MGAIVWNEFYSPSPRGSENRYTNSTPSIELIDGEDLDEVLPSIRPNYSRKKWAATFFFVVALLFVVGALIVVMIPLLNVARSNAGKDTMTAAASQSAPGELGSIIGSDDASAHNANSDGMQESIVVNTVETGEVASSDHKDGEKGGKGGEGEKAPQGAPTTKSPAATPLDYPFLRTIPGEGCDSYHGKGQRRLPSGYPDDQRHERRDHTRHRRVDQQSHANERQYASRHLTYNRRTPFVTCPMQFYILINQGVPVEIGSYLVELVVSTFGSTSATSTSIKGFPTGAASIENHVLPWTSVTVASLDVLEKFVLNHTSSEDYSLLINDSIYLPVVVLPVASKPMLQAPQEPIRELITLSVGRTDPDEILSVELRMQRDPRGVLLGSIATTKEVPGAILRDQGSGVYRIETSDQTSDKIPSSEYVENAINQLLDGTLSFVVNAEALPGYYAQGIHVIATSTDTDEEEGQIATASAAIFLPVIAGDTTIPTSSPVAQLAITLVEDVPKVIGTDIERLMELFLPLSMHSKGFQVSGFPVEATVSYTKDGNVHTSTVQNPDVTFKFANLSELRTLLVLPPPQSDQDFTLIVVDESLSARLDIPVSVLGVADQPSVRAVSPAVSRDGSSVAIRLYPEIGADRDGSEYISVLFQVAVDNSTQMPIGTLALEPKVQIPGTNFTRLGGGVYKAEVTRRSPVIGAASLRLLLVSGSVLFTPSTDLVGDYPEGVVVTVLSREKDASGLAPNDNLGAGTDGDKETGVETAIAPVRIVIIKSSTSNPTRSLTSTPSLGPISRSTMPSFVALTTRFPSRPIAVPGIEPSSKPSTGPILLPPSSSPSAGPSATTPTFRPSVRPSLSPSSVPSVKASSPPDRGMSLLLPSSSPSAWPSVTTPTSKPTVLPSLRPSSVPIDQASSEPTGPKLFLPSTSPSVKPSVTTPTLKPSAWPSLRPSSVPIVQVSSHPTGSSLLLPSTSPSVKPSVTTQTLKPSAWPSLRPSSMPIAQVSSHPTGSSLLLPSTSPSARPSVTTPSLKPSAWPSLGPSSEPIVQVSSRPTGPSTSPSVKPSVTTQTLKPSAWPSLRPSSVPIVQVSSHPTGSSLLLPSTSPSARHSVTTPSLKPSAWPSLGPSSEPIVQVSSRPTGPSTSPSVKPSVTTQTLKPSAWPSLRPSSVPIVQVSSHPTGSSLLLPSTSPSARPSVTTPSLKPSAWPSLGPSSEPIVQVSSRPTGPSTSPSGRPSVTTSTLKPSAWPSLRPSSMPSVTASSKLSTEPSLLLASSPPSASPSVTVPISPRPSSNPSLNPSSMPTGSLKPSSKPSKEPTSFFQTRPSAHPTTSSSPIITPSIVPNYRVTLGDSSNYVDIDGNVWLSDFFLSGMAVDECSADVLIGIDDRGLYCRYRQWNTSSTGPLLLPVSTSGYYKVTLHFTETSAAVGARIVDIFVMGYRIFTGIDIASLIGGSGVFTLDITGYSTDGTINVEIIASAGFPLLSAIEREFIPTSVSPFEVRVNSGATTSFVDASGNTWLPDNFFLGGETFSICPASINNTIDDEIYCSERFGHFNYSVPVPGFGFYRVVLHFAEILYEASGLRVFDVLVNGKPLAPNFDIFNVVGKFSAKTVEATIQLSSYSISIEFNNLVENPKISGFEIYDVTGMFEQPTLVNCGGPEYIDSNQRVWMADTYFSGGQSFSYSTFGIDGTEDDTLYLSERNGVFSYNIPVTIGTYNVTLYFAELFWTESSQRLFDIFVQSSLRATNVDIIDMAGANVTAAELSFSSVAAIDGFVNIDFVAIPLADVPKISAIKVVRG